MSLSPETHRLTNITGAPPHPFVCQSCGGSNREHFGPPRVKLLQRWQEHDHNDRPEARVLVLCGACSDRLIEQHPRLYHPLEKNQPWPGCMDICVDCAHRSGTRCTHPDAKANGGPGVRLKVGQQVRMHVDMVDKHGRRRGVWYDTYDKPPSECRQKEV